MLVFVATLGMVVAIPIAGNAQQQGDFCGGIAAFPCPEGYTCVDDPSDDCDPLAGGADCNGMCVKQHDKDCVDLCRSKGLTGRAFGDCVSSCARGECDFDTHCPPSRTTATAATPVRSARSSLTSSAVTGRLSSASSTRAWGSRRTESRIRTLASRSQRPARTRKSRI